MLERLKALFLDDEAGSDGGSRRHDHGELQLAVAVLLVEAARLDGDFDEAERDTIQRLVESRLEFDGEEAAALIAAAEETTHDSVELWSFARVVKDRFDYDERIEMVEMLWEVVYADGKLHDYEASLLRRISGLLYVSDQDSGGARKRVMKRLGVVD